MHILFGVIFLFLAVAAMMGSSKHREELLKWAIPAAVEIAYAREWVSPHRLMNQLHLTKSDAQMVLREACAQGYLFQALNGKYYPDTRNIPGIKTIEADGAGEPAEIKKPFGFMTLLVWLSAVAFLISVIGWGVNKDTPKEPAATAASLPPQEDKAISEAPTPQQNAPPTKGGKKHHGGKKQDRSIVKDGTNG